MIPPKSVAISYILWMIGGFGALGFHRFYLGKIGTGIIWLLTGGCLMIGSLIDLFLIPVLVREANFKQGFR